MLICKNCGTRFDGVYGICPACGKSYQKPNSKPYTTSGNPLNMKKYIIIGSFLTAVFIGMVISGITIINKPYYEYITNLDDPYSEQYKDIESSTESSEESRSATEIASELIKSETFGMEKIRLKIWGSKDDKEYIKAKIEEFESIYAIDGIEYDIYYVQINDENVVPRLNEDMSKCAEVFYFPAEEFETAVEKNLLAEVTHDFYGKIEDSNTEQDIESCMSNNKLYSYPIVSGDGSRMIGVNSKTNFPFTTSLFAMHLSGIDLRKYK